MFAGEEVNEGEVLAWISKELATNKVKNWKEIAWKVQSDVFR